MGTSNALGEFLRARREQLRPQDAGGTFSSGAVVQAWTVRRVRPRSAFRTARIANSPVSLVVSCASRSRPAPNAVGAPQDPAGHCLGDRPDHPPGEPGDRPGREDDLLGAQVVAGQVGEQRVADGTDPVAEPKERQQHRHCTVRGPAMAWRGGGEQSAGFLDASEADQCLGCGHQFFLPIGVTGTACACPLPRGGCDAGGISRRGASYPAPTRAPPQGRSPPRWSAAQTESNPLSSAAAARSAARANRLLWPGGPARRAGRRPDR
jgi:hypothetical protein